MKSSDRNLLLGILAVQLEFINSAQLIEAASRWMLNKHRSLGDLLLEAQALGRPDLELLESLVDRHIARSGSIDASLQQLRDASSAEFSRATEMLAHFQDGNKTPGPTPGDPATVSFSGTTKKSDSAQRFSVLRELARGGLGELFVARDEELEREVALKKILNSRANLEVQQRFLAEAKITGNLEHPGVVPVYALGTLDDGQPFYAMRLIRGRSLSHCLTTLHATPVQERSKHSFDREFRQLLRAVVEACYAIAYAHSRGVLHRDIKPQNIMVGKFGETLVVDWGLAKVVGIVDENPLRSEAPLEDNRSSESTPTELGTVLGTPGYMSPEQATGRLNILDRRSDVFSLGATLYAVLTGQSPYPGPDRQEALRAAQACDYRWPRTLNPAVPRSLEAICLKAMATSPAERYDTALELAEDLDAWIAGAPVVAYPETLVMRAFRFARRHQTIVASLLVFLLVSSSGLVIANRAISVQRDRARVERDNAEVARAQAQTDREKADQARMVAAHNSQVGIEILDQFVKNLADDRWAQLPGFEKERLNMVELSLTRFTELLEESPDNVAIKKHVCQMLIRSANIHRSRGEIDKAIQRIQGAKRFASELSSMFAEDPDFLGLYSDALVYASIVQDQKSGPAHALEDVMAAVEASRARVMIQPADHSQVGYVLALIGRGELYGQLSQYDLAIADLKLAAETISQTKSKYRTVLLGTAQSGLAEIYLNQGNIRQATEIAQALHDQVEAALVQSPTAPDLRTLLVAALKNLATAASAELQFEQAQQHLIVAVATLERMILDHPGNISFKRMSIEVANLQAEIALRQGELAACQQMLAKSTAQLDSLDDKPSAKLRAVSLLTHALMCRLSSQRGATDELLQYQQRFETLKTEISQWNQHDPILKRVATLVEVER